MQQPIRWEWRYIAAVATLIFNGAVIWFLLLKGRDGSALHADALTWAFILSGGVLAGMGLGPVVEPIVKIMKGK